jgi:hypothetical protein
MTSVISLSLASGVLKSDNPCRECHVSYYEYSRFNPSSELTLLPQEIDEDIVYVKIAIEVSGSSTSSKYRIDTLRVSLQSRDGNVNILNPEEEWNYLFPGGRVVFSSPVAGIANGSDRLTFELYAYNPHGESEFTDTYSYDIIVSGVEGAVEQPAVTPSSWTVIISEEGTKVTLFINREIKNLEIVTPKGISAEPNEVSSAHAGDEIKVFFSTSVYEKVEGNISVSWQEDDLREEITLFALYTPAEVDYFSLIGRVTGMFSFFLLIASIVLGGVGKKIRRVIDRGIGAGCRVRIHCFISWFLFVICIFHGLILVIGPYRDFIWSAELVLGYLSITCILILGISGSFKGTIVKKIGLAGWRKMHMYYALVALLLCILHMVMIGTDFQFIRDFLGI